MTSRHSAAHWPSLINPDILDQVTGMHLTWISGSSTYSSYTEGGRIVHVNQYKAASSLRGFAVELERRTSEVYFEGPVAKYFWDSIRLEAIKNIARLFDLVKQVEIHSDDDFELFKDLLELSVETLDWALDDEVAYAEALAEAGKVLAERLHESKLITTRIPSLPQVEVTVSQSSSRGSQGLYTGVVDPRYLVGVGSCSGALPRYQGSPGSVDGWIDREYATPTPVGVLYC